MAIEFEFYKTPDPSGEKQTTYHPRAVAIETIDTQRIAYEIHRKSSLSVGDVRAVLVALSEEIAHELGNSKRVYLEGIGYFQATLKSDKEVDPTRTRAQSVWFKSVKYRADQQLKEKLINVGTRRAWVRNHSQLTKNEDIDRKLSAYFEKEKYLTRKQLEGLCGMTQITAARHLTRLKKEGKIENIGTTRNAIYVKQAGKKEE